MPLFTYKASIHYQSASGPAVNTLAVVGDTGTGVTDAQVAADRLHESWGNSLMPQICNYYKLDHVEVASPAGSVSSTLAPVTGGNTGAANATNACYLVKKQVASGRRGRIFLPGVSENALLPDGSIKASSHASVQAAVTDLYGSLLFQGLNPVLIRANGSEVPVTSFILSNWSGVQNRRFRR